MTFEINSHQLLFKMLNNTNNLAEVLKQAENYCKNCNPISPMTCVEHCEIWKVKNEFLDMKETLDRKNHVSSLLNAIKNRRRLKIMEALSERPRSIKGLQEYLRTNGYYHSRRTINDYLRPLIGTGLIKKDGDRYGTTLYGRKFHDMLRKFSFENPLPKRSRCYEESILRKLNDEPRSFVDLAGATVQKSLSRALKRLKEKGLITKSQTSEYVFYFKTVKEPNTTFSPTEKRVFEVIPDVGVSAHELSRKVGISLRRTYKYLRKLKKKKLVFAKKKSRTYELTPSGRKVASFLEEVTNYALEASKASAFMHNA